jgi:hypothetical protein
MLWKGGEKWTETTPYTGLSTNQQRRQIQPYGTRPESTERTGLGTANSHRRHAQPTTLIISLSFPRPIPTRYSKSLRAIQSLPYPTVCGTSRGGAATDYTFVMTSYEFMYFHCSRLLNIQPFFPFLPISFIFAYTNSRNIRRRSLGGYRQTLSSQLGLARMFLTACSARRSMSCQ